MACEYNIPKRKWIEHPDVKTNLYGTVFSTLPSLRRSEHRKHRETKWLTYFWFTDKRQKIGDPILRKRRMETGYLRRNIHFQWPKGGGDCHEWARRYRNRRRTDQNWLENDNETFYDVKEYKRNTVNNKLPYILRDPKSGGSDAICCSISLKINP